MSAGINRYKADLRELFFVLFEQYDFNSIAGKGDYEGWDEETARAVLKETYRFSTEVLGPLNSSGDREGCKLVDGRVITPKGFKDAWKQLFEAGIKQVAVPREFGGTHAPFAVYALIEEITSGANTAFNMYPGLAWGAAEVIAQCGTDAQKKNYADKMFNGTWGGTMCLTEPHAGSDVGSAATKAVKQADGTYKITGTKIFISGGDHDLAENVMHLVLARVEDAPAGTKGLSLFIVPRLKVKRRRHARRAQRRRGGQHRAQDGHQRLGHLRAQLRRERRLHRRAGRHRREPGHAPDVPHDERRAHRRGHPGPGGRLERVPERARVREGSQAGLALHPVQGSQGAARGDHRAPRRAPHAARDEGHHRGHPRAGGEARFAPRPVGRAGRQRRRRRPPTTRARSTCSRRW